MSVAGVVVTEYVEKAGHVEWVKITNVPAFLHATEVPVECPDLGRLTVDIAYGGNFYAIVEPQRNYRDLSEHTSLDLIRWSPILRAPRRSGRAPARKGRGYSAWTKTAKSCSMAGSKRRRGSATRTRSCPRSAAGPKSRGSTPSSSTSATRSVTVSQCYEPAGG